MGGWVQPQNTIVTLLFADRVHGIVTLDGFNEHYFIKKPSASLGLPGNTFAFLQKLRYTGNPILEYTTSLFSDIALLQYRYPLLRHSQTLDLIMATANRFGSSFNPNLNPERLKKNNDRKNSYYGHWALPKDWSKDQMREYNLSQYKKYLKQTKSIGDISATKTSFFLQPTPAMHKELSDYEKSILKNQPIDYLDAYIKIEKTFLSLKDEGLDVYSLTKIYEDVKESIYSDGIHAITTQNS